MKLQDKVVLNIIKYMDSLDIEIVSNNKIKTYSNYLSKITDISEKRLNNILDINKKRIVRLNEVEQICYSLNIDMYKIFK